MFTVLGKKTEPYSHPKHGNENVSWGNFQGNKKNGNVEQRKLANILRIFIKSQASSISPMIVCNECSR